MIVKQKDPDRAELIRLLLQYNAFPLQENQLHRSSIESLEASEKIHQTEDGQVILELLQNYMNTLNGKFAPVKRLPNPERMSKVIYNEAICIVPYIILSSFLEIALEFAPSKRAHRNGDRI